MSSVQKCFRKLPIYFLKMKLYILGKVFKNVFQKEQMGSRVLQTGEVGKRLTVGFGLFMRSVDSEKNIASLTL